MLLNHFQNPRIMDLRDNVASRAKERLNLPLADLQYIESLINGAIFSTAEIVTEQQENN